MSDADDSDFDKEAERERLREKYEAEQADREAAQQMSDLLLKGATMTNAHCDRCGSPIFRVDGQEFCPSCSQEDGEAAGSANAQAATGAQSGATDAQAGGETAASTQDGTEEPSPDERLRNVVSGGDSSGDEAPASTGGTSIAERAAQSVQSQDQPDQPEGSADHDGAGAGTGPASSPADRSPAGTPTVEGDASLADAQQSLLNAITQHAQAATAADPRTARDHLEAANEAAEALATISPEN